MDIELINYEGNTFDERMRKLRNEYSVSNQQSLAWGFDHSGGFFVQVFDNSNVEEEVLIVDADQGNTLSNFSLSSERLTYDKMVETLTKYSEKALHDFQSLMNKHFDETLFGYAYDKNGKYEEKVCIRNSKELFHFIDSIQHDFTITDGWDLLMDLRAVKELVAA